MKKKEYKQSLNRLAVRVIEEVEDLELTNLVDVLKKAQVLFEAKIMNEGIEGVVIPNFINLRKKRFNIWLYLVISYFFTLLYLPIFVNKGFVLGNLKSQLETNFISSLIIFSIFIYSFFKSPNKQLKKIMKVASCEILKQLGSRQLERDLNVLAVGVMEEIEAKNVNGLNAVLETAQKIYEEKLLTKNLNIACPDLKVLRNKRLIGWSIFFFIFFSLLIWPIFFDPLFERSRERQAWGAVLYNFILFLPIYCYSFFRPPLNQLKRLLEISNKKIIKNAGCND